MPTTRFARNDGVRIAYEVHTPPGGHGDGAPWLLLMHGLGYARWGWEPVVDRFAAAHRVVLFDNRGIGESDVPPGPYDAATMAGDAQAVLDAVGAASAHIVGTSLGGMIAQELALAAADRVDRLVLAASTPGGDAAFPMPAQTRELIARMPDMEPVAALEAAIDNALSPVTRARRPEIARRILDHRLAQPQDPAGWQAQAAAGTTYDAGGRLGEITAPCLVLHGADDRVVDPRNAELIAEALPHAELVVMPDVGHLPYWEQPENFTHRVLDFLRAEG